MVRQSPGHKVGSMLIPLARSRNIPVDCSTSAARLHLHAACDGESMDLPLGPLSVKPALPLVALQFTASQRQSFEHTLVSELRLGVWLLASPLSGCALVFSRSLVLLIHRSLKCFGLSPAACPRASQDNAVYNRREVNCYPSYARSGVELCADFVPDRTK